MKLFDLSCHAAKENLDFIGMLEAETEGVSAGGTGRRSFLAGLGALLLAGAAPSAAEAAIASSRSIPFRRDDEAVYRNSKIFRAKLMMLREIKRCLGKPYVWGAEGPDRFDCSGLVMWLYGRIGVRLPRVAVEQGSVGIRVPDRLRFGDVILFKRKGPGWHIGFYLAKSRFVHAANRNEGVIISNVRERYWREQFRDARRYIEG